MYIKRKQLPILIGFSTLRTYKLTNLAVIHLRKGKSLFPSYTKLSDNGSTSTTLLSS